MLKSDCDEPATVTVALAEAAVGFGFGIGEFAYAVLVMKVPFATPAFTFTTNVNVTLVPLAKDGVLHTIEPVVPTVGVLQLQLGPLMETKVVFVGNVSYSPLGAAAAGP